jgi:hypothetical protein
LLLLLFSLGLLLDDAHVASEPGVLRAVAAEDRTRLPVVLPSGLASEKMKNEKTQD